jgi:RNA recognition motif-containing protein
MSRERSRDRGRDRSYEEEKVDARDNPQIYVGRLPRGLHGRDLEDIFIKFGEIRSCLMKRGFAFIVRLRIFNSTLGVR